jgi:hypothetical protein
MIRYLIPYCDNYYPKLYVVLGRTNHDGEDFVNPMGLTNPKGEIGMSALLDRRFPWESSSL